MASNSNTASSGGYVTTLTGWLAKPFNSDMDAVAWVLFLGFVIIVAFLWTRILKHIVEGV